MPGEAADDKEVKGEEDAGADTGKEDKKADKDKDDDVVPVRKGAKTNADYARERLAHKDKKGSKEEDEEPDLTPKARKLIEEEVDRRVAPLQDELAFRDYFAAHPEDRKYEKKARARFDAWGTVPIEEVMKTLRPSAESEDKEEKDKAEEKAQRGSMRGSTNRPKEETVATTQPELKKVYKDVKSGNTGAALKALGIK